MEGQLPPWLSHSFLQRVLLDGTGADVSDLSFSCQLAVPAGTNYVSQVYRVSVTYRISPEEDKRSMSLIVKVPSENTSVRALMEEFNTYGREVLIYKDVIPIMQELHNLRVAPKSFFCPMESSLVLEDLKAVGFKMVDRLMQLDVPHCRQFLQTLAKFHAVSLLVNRKNPRLMDNLNVHWLFNDKVSDEKKQQYKEKSDNYLRGFAKTLENLEGCISHAEMITRKIDGYWERMVHLMKPGKRFDVLNHGDTWITNILFRYNTSGDPVETRLVDYQIAQFRPFPFDLMYFWWSSTNVNVREHHREEMFEVYRQTLNTTLQELKCTERLTKGDFDRHMKDCASFSVFVVATIVPIALADPEDLTDFEKMFDSSPKNAQDGEYSIKSLFVKNFNSKYYKAQFPKLLYQLEEFGAFE